MSKKTNIILWVLLVAGVTTWNDPSGRRNDSVPGTEQKLASHYAGNENTALCSSRDQSNLLDIGRKTQLSSSELHGTTYMVKYNFAVLKAWDSETSSSLGYPFRSLLLLCNNLII